MPKPHKGEKKKDFISRCIPMLIDEGKEKDQAAAICYSFWERKDEETENILDKVLNEAKNEYVVMFFDPALEGNESKRKNTLVTGKVIKDKLHIVDGEVWLGASFEDDVMPSIADLVKKWKPTIVFIEDNYFQRLLNKVMKDYNIPFKGVSRVTSKAAVEQAAESPDMIWKAKKNPDLFFGAGSLLLVLKKMKKIMDESTVIGDIFDKDTPVKDTKKKKCKKSKKFKEELLKECA